MKSSKLEFSPFQANLDFKSEKQLNGLPQVKKSPGVPRTAQKPALPQIGTGPLRIQLASKPPPSQQEASHEGDTDHSFIQQSWTVFSTLNDMERNQLLKGIIARCSTKQIQLICTCLNLKQIDATVPGLKTVFEVNLDDQDCA